MNRRDFLAVALMLTGAFLFPTRRVFGAVQHKYGLASEKQLPEDIRKASLEVREAYRFAIANRDILRYIPCYCGCVAEGHTSNASCYIKDSSTPQKLDFDRMSLG